MKKIKDIISYIWSVLNKNTPEGIFIVLLLFAMVRLAFMQLPIFKHENYKVLYDIYVENDKINVTAGEILDRNGRSLARQAKVAEMTIKSFKKQKEERFQPRQVARRRRPRRSGRKPDEGR